MFSGAGNVELLAVDQSKYENEDAGFANRITGERVSSAEKANYQCVAHRARVSEFRLSYGLGEHRRSVSCALLR